MAKDVLTIAVFDADTGWYLDEQHVERIRGAAEGHAEVRQVRHYNELLEFMPETSYLMSFPLTEEHLESHAPKLRWIQLVASTGDDNASLRAALDHGVRISTAAPIRAPQVAEHALALLMALTRRVKDSVIAQTEHRWEPGYLSTCVRDLHGSTIGVVGAMPVGRAIADRLHAFGAHTTLFDVRPDPGEAAGESPHDVLPLASLDEQAPLLDALVIACPYTPATDSLVDADLLGRLKHSAVLVDVSKGGIVEERPLLLALRRGRLAMAALDVFQTEPLAPTSPLWTMPNVIITPHVCGASPGYWSRATDVLCENFKRLVEGAPMLDEISAGWYARRVPA